VSKKYIETAVVIRYRAEMLLEKNAWERIPSQDISGRNDDISIGSLLYVEV
jgi:hypothetical protein